MDSLPLDNYCIGIIKHFVWQDTLDEIHKILESNVKWKLPSTINKRTTTSYWYYMKRKEGLRQRLLIIPSNDYIMYIYNCTYGSYDSFHENY